MGRWGPAAFSQFQIVPWNLIKVLAMVNLGAVTSPLLHKNFDPIFDGNNFHYLYTDDMQYVTIGELSMCLYP